MTEPTTSPELPSYSNPSGIPYFHPSHNISPQKAGKMLVSVARSHMKAKPAAKGGKQAPRIQPRSGRGLVRSAGSLHHGANGGKK